jgi:opacity protein-like surface antigen
MLKKVLLTNIMLAATGVAFANGGSFVPPAPNCVGAFYVGAAVSRDLAHFKTNDVFSVSSASVNNPFLPISPAALDFSRKFDWNANGYDGELFAGYGMVFNDHYTLAAEAFADLSSDKGTITETFRTPIFNSVFVGSSNVRVKNSFGASILPGFKLSSSTNLFARVGWVDSRFQEQAGLRIAGSNSLITPVNSGLLVQATQSTYKSGIQLGLGMETMVTQNVGIRGEYDWNRYGAISGVKQDDKATIEQFKLAALYHFYS